MMRAVVLALAVLGCNGTRGDSDELGEAKVQVRRFFAAIAASDCPTLAQLLPAANEPGTCAKLLHEWNEELQLRLVDLPDAQRDGRDRRAMIVRATVSKRGQESTMLVRVTHEQGTWRLVL